MHFFLMLLMWVALGAAVGWGASLIIRAGGRQGVVFDTTFGALGGVSGGALVAQLFTQRLGEQTLMVSVAAASVGAAVVVGLWRLILLPQTAR